MSIQGRIDFLKRWFTTVHGKDGLEEFVDTMINGGVCTIESWQSPENVVNRYHEAPVCHPSYSKYVDWEQALSDLRSGGHIHYFENHYIWLR